VVIHFNLYFFNAEPSNLIISSIQSGVLLIVDGALAHAVTTDDKKVGHLKQVPTSYI
jgi:hypothetical protein